MFHGPAAAVEDNRLARVFSGFASDLGKEGREPKIVIHRPTVEGVVVALGALDAHAHEGLRDILREFERVALDLIEIGCGRLEARARGGE